MSTTCFTLSGTQRDVVSAQIAEKTVEVPQQVNVPASVQGLRCSLFFLVREPVTRRRSHKNPRWMMIQSTAFRGKSIRGVKRARLGCLVIAPARLLQTQRGKNWLDVWRMLGRHAEKDLFFRLARGPNGCAVPGTLVRSEHVCFWAEVSIDRLQNRS